MPWWIGGAVVAVVAVLALAVPVTVSGSNSTESQSCGSSLSTLSRRLDGDLAAEGDVSPGPGVCEDPLADRGSAGVALLVMAVFTAATGWATRHWQGLIVLVIAGFVVIWHFAWPLTLPAEGERFDELRCGSPALTSTSSLLVRLSGEEDAVECAAARANRVARGGLAAVLALPLVLAGLTGRRDDELS